MREYEKHQAANGNPPSHAFAKELMAGIAAAEVIFCLPSHFVFTCTMPPMKSPSARSTAFVVRVTPCVSRDRLTSW